MENRELMRFWGKAQPRDPTCGPSWHPLAYHSLDVAATARALLRRDEGLQERFSELTGLRCEDVMPVLCYLLGTHDIGKFAQRFQAKVPELFRNSFDGDPARLPDGYDHGAGGMRMFRVCPEVFQLPRISSPRAWMPLVSAVTGHHGAPPATNAENSLVSLKIDYGSIGITAAGEFARQIRELLNLPSELDGLRVDQSKRASHAVAGLAVLVDWIGSNQDWFPYQEPKMELREYWEDIQPKADAAVEQSGVLSATISNQFAYKDLLGAKIHPSPMQHWAETVDIPPAPAMFLIEDETGSGKTEAALMLAHRLMRASHACGVYVALPTMATANAMFDRLANRYRRFFASDTEPSLALAHGAKDLHQGFQDAVLRAGRLESSYANLRDGEDESATTASAACAEWIADDRRRAFLADVGAGSIDQALLAVLPSKHQSLRLLGLMRRVLILDEVHAYDAYMRREMERLIEFQAGLGGSTVLLSATLPLSVRQRLAAAFAKGAGMEKTLRDHGMEYPLATIWSKTLTTATPIAGMPGRARRLPVRFLRTAAEAYDEVAREAQAGRALLYIRNTVDDAVEAHRQLAGFNVEARLFHARYALCDRLRLERRFVGMFGKASVDSKRRGKVLVATQVVEQSLDLDFDAMITDLAPIDLVVQRAGRLWRHGFRQRSGRMELLVVGPEPTVDAGEAWFSDAFPKAAYVYKDHARLWLTARVLEERGVIDSPTELRELIEAVYGDDVNLEVPEGLQSCFWKAHGRDGAEQGVAGMNLLALQNGYIRDGAPWDSDHRISTRLNDLPQVTLRLAVIEDGDIKPYACHQAPDNQMEGWKAWRLSEVNVSANRVGGEAVPSEYLEKAEQAKSGWTRFDAEKILVLLQATDSGGNWRGLAKSPNSPNGDIQVSYNATRGLEISPT